VTALISFFSEVLEVGKFTVGTVLQVKFKGLGFSHLAQVKSREAECMP
jgi:hypothetical protein